MKAIKTIFSASFDELNEDQKAQAVEVMRDIENRDSTPYWAVDITNQWIEDLDTEYGVTYADIQWSGFCSQGDGASISSDYQIDIERFLRKCKVWSKFRQLHRFISGFSCESEISMKVNRSGGRYCHSNMVSGEVSFDWGVDYTPVQEAAAERLEEFLTDKIRELSDQIYKELNAENDYHDSDECLIELIKSNDYHFEVLDGEVQGLA